MFVIVCGLGGVGLGQKSGISSDKTDLGCGGGWSVAGFWASSQPFRGRSISHHGNGEFCEVTS